MGLFFPSSAKKPNSSGVADSKEGRGSSSHKYDHNSRGKIISRELPLIHRRLVNKIGRVKAEKFMEQLEANLDTDGAVFGGKNVSAQEIDAMMRTLEKNDYNNLDRSDLNKAREIFEEYE